MWLAACTGLETNEFDALHVSEACLCLCIIKLAVMVVICVMA